MQPRPTLFDPLQTWKQRTYENCTARCLTHPHLPGGQGWSMNGRACGRSGILQGPDRRPVGGLRFEYPHRYYVDLSQRLWDCRQELLETISKLGNA